MPKKRKGKARTPPYEKYPQWSTAKYYSFLRSKLRQAWQRWPPKYEAINKNRRPAEYEWKSETGRKLNVKWEVKCDGCGEWYPQSWVDVDHKVPAGSLKHHDDLPQFVEHLLCSVEDLQCLCKECHAEKTKEERSK
jgi:hypothetical protein